MRYKLKIENIIQDCLKGNERAKTKLYNFVYDSVNYVVSKFFKDPDTVNELIQLSFIRIFESLHKLDNTYLKSWCGIITKNICIDYIKNNKRKKSIQLEYKDCIFDNDLLNVVPINEEEIDYTKLYDAIESLSPACKISIKMFYFDKLSFKEIANKFNIKETSAKANCHKGRKKLEKKLEKSFFI